MLAMKDEIVPELAWQMGRPIRYGAGELRGFEERARYMIGIAEGALADHDPGRKGRLHALYQPGALWAWSSPSRRGITPISRR